MKTRIIQTKIWTDNFFINLTPLEKLLFIYFITNDQVNIIHLYQCPINRIIADTGINRGIIEKVMVKFQEANKIFFYGGYVFLYNARKYETYSGELNERSKQRLLEELSSNVLEWYKKILDRGIDTPLKGSINHNTEISNKKSEISNKKYSTLKEIKEEEIKEIALKYKVPESFVMSKLDDLTNYCQSKNKRYSNYKATLMNWVKRDAIKIISSSKKNDRYTGAVKL